MQSRQSEAPIGIEAKSQPTRLIITVDTETFTTNNSHPAFQTNIYANLPKGVFGVQRIMDICERQNVKATFFVDVYMHYHYGKELVRELCRTIADAGHDVQLHAHTSWLPGSISGKLCEFSREKQSEIIAEGRDLIGDWVGKAPVAFRAGAYTANLDTIYALERNGFVIDSSYFAFHPNCALSSELGNRYVNRPFYLGKILEVPVTCYWLACGLRYRKLSKVDINACSRAELNDIIPKLIQARLSHVILFLHSFSFIRWNRKLTGVRPNFGAMERFEGLLAPLKCIPTAGGGGAQFCTMADLAMDAVRPQLDVRDFVPALKATRILSRGVLRLVG